MNYASFPKSSLDQLSNKIFTSLCSSNGLFQRINWDFLDAPRDGVVWKKRTKLISYGITAHYPGISTAPGLTKFSLMYKMLLLLRFSEKTKKGMHCFTQGVSFYTWSRWAISTTSCYFVFFLFKKRKDFVSVFCIFLLDADIVKLLWEIREQGLTSTIWIVARFYYFPWHKHGRNLVRDTGDVSPHFFRRGDIICHVPPTFFLFGFVIGKVSKIKVMFVIFCVKSFSFSC